MELLVVGYLLVGLVLSVMAMLDALRSSDAQWHAIGRRRIVWVAAIGAGTLFWPAAPVAPTVYLLTVRPALAAAKSVAP